MQFVEWRKSGANNNGQSIIIPGRKSSRNLLDEEYNCLILGDRSMPIKAIVFEEMIGN